ncbi:MAG TPA: CheR family methyltransferase [Lacipirellulaceae bacterium]|nr:CheR family methyltransferase [Lacipirellulaceae bacterium]
MFSPASYQHLRFEGRPGGVGAPGELLDGPPPRAPQRGPSTRPEPQLDAPQRRLVEAALTVAGLDPAQYRTGPFVRRMPAVLRALQCPDIETACVRVSGSVEDARRALDALLIGHTEPFRDPKTFVELRSRVLGPLSAGRSGLSVWSVACSAGVELASAALLLAERGLLGGSRLRGSDCRAKAIETARLLSLQRLAASLPPELAELRPLLDDPAFGAAIATVEWVVENALTAEPDPAGWDVVFCRNLAIYLDSSSSERLWARLVAALAPGGVLVTGRAERPPRHLPLERVAKSIFRRTRGAV